MGNFSAPILLVIYTQKLKPPVIHINTDEFHTHTHTHTHTYFEIWTIWILKKLTMWGYRDQLNTQSLSTATVHVTTRRSWFICLAEIVILWTIQWDRIRQTSYFSSIWSWIIWHKKIFIVSYLSIGASSTVGWCIMLQAGTSRVRFPIMSLEFVLTIPLAALWSIEKWVPGRRTDLTNFMHWMSWNLVASTTCSPKGLYRDSFTFTFYIYHLGLLYKLNSS
jgi:hypothetical protein